MLIEASNTVAKVLYGTDEERAWLNDYLSFPDTRARFRNYSGDGRLRMMNSVTGTFPAGFLSMVRKNAAAEGFAVEVKQRTACPVERDESADTSWLRDYQRAAVDAVEKHGRGIIWLPTGSGKTEIAVGLTQSFPVPWLLLVNSIDLVNQAADRYELRTKQRAGRIGEGRFDVEGASFIAATFQTVARMLEANDPRARTLAAQAEGLIIDESHTLPADSFFRVAQAMHAAYFRVGLSGTPLARGDRKSSLAVGALGPVIYRVRTEVLVERGVIVRPHVTMVRHVHDKPQSAGKRIVWAHVYNDAIVRNAARNAKVIAAVKRAEKPCIVFVKAIPHGAALKKMLEREGFNVGFVSGENMSAARKQHIKALQSGRADVLVASVVFQTGIDIPDLRSAVIATGGRSAIAAIQRIGRGMRTAEGKEAFEVYDIDDVACGCKLAAKAIGLAGSAGTHPTCRMLETHTQERVKAYLSEGYKVVRDVLL